jgi:histidinol dehydrogenase
MLKFLNYNKKNSLNNLEIILNKRKFTQKNHTKIVKKIISNVKKNGDKAVIKYEKKFSKIKTGSAKIIFSKKEINEISKKADKKIKQSIDLAFNRIKKFHGKQKFLPFSLKDKYKNELSYKYSPIEKVGVYVPWWNGQLPKHRFNELYSSYSRRV